MPPLPADKKSRPPVVIKKNTPPPDDRWRPSRVLVWIKNDEQRKLDGHLCGQVFVCPSRYYEGWWNVMSATTGLQILVVQTLEDAKKVGEVLWDHNPVALMQDEKYRIRDRMKGWVAGWVKACLAEGKYVDHGPWERGEKVYGQADG